MSKLTFKTRYGTFNGFDDENGVKTWLGIPFAQPPVGKLRWRAPQSLTPTDKTLDAKKNTASRLCKSLTITKAHLKIRKAKIA
ncbi:MAG: carboxylesterase family protein [Selenomonadaceae bacterium]|nr:carboxylesterase family protein [Selenomonadaceae bacterium]